MLHQSNGTGRVFKVLFLGQCLQYGYESVSGSATFPTLAAAMLRTRLPDLTLKFESKYLSHPRGLKAILSHRLRLSPPDLAVISLPAMYAARSWRVNRIYEIAPEVVDTARSFLQKIETKLKGNNGPPRATTLLDKTFALHEPLSLGEYERLVREALEFCQRTSSCRFVLIGPGRFNEDTVEHYAVHSPELWSSVNQMVSRLGARLKLPVINAQETLAEYGGEVFIPNNHRWSAYGHEVIAREVESVLARQIAGLSCNAPGLRNE